MSAESAMSIHLLLIANQITVIPTTTVNKPYSFDAKVSGNINVNISDDMTVTIPALPIIIKLKIIRLLTGWFIMFSDSDVVNPTPVYAERDWDFALSVERPVWTNAIVAIFVIKAEMETTKKRVMAAIICDGIRDATIMTSYGKAKTPKQSHYIAFKR